ncbi:SH3 domain-containing protein [Brevibacillus centrosporus]|uniref:SH3 domain-containing protein n=1 Tax=Brevibacillus centrosporus TaxID=54910 RepID=UPI003D1D5909
MISSYQKSLWSRNLMLVLVVAAVIGVALKIGWSLQKIKLYDQALAYYEAKDLVKAEETFAKANEHAGIEYGDEAWTTQMSGLTDIREELESLSRQAQPAIKDNREEEVLQAYRSYQSFKREVEGRQEAQTATFFQTISTRLGLEKGWSAYYQQAIQHAKAQMQSLQVSDQQALIHTLVLVPDEFFGGTEKKAQELEALFRRYETAKLQERADSLSFLDVITQTAKSIELYRQEGISSDWLQKQLERYAKGEIGRVIRQNDLPGFVAMAKAYRQIQNVLPDKSEVLATIETHLQSLIEQAEKYAKQHKFTKATDLYQELSGLLDTSSLLAGVDELWTQFDPSRLLQQKYPDQAFDPVFTGSDHWGAKTYAIGVDQKEHRIYFAAKPTENEAPVSFDLALDIDTDFTFTLSKLEDDHDSPVLLVSSVGKERAYLYTGVVPQLSKNSFDTRFVIEADDLTIEDAARVIVKNAVGPGENELASFEFGRKGLEYVAKLEDLQPEHEEPADPASPSATEEEGDSQSGQGTPELPGAPSVEVPHTPSAGHSVDVYAGPGKEYKVIGQVSLDSSIQVVTDLNGWYQIQFDGKEGWIETPKTAN